MTLQIAFFYLLWRGKATVNFINLTNGIEAIADLPEGWSAIRISSTVIEKSDWELLITDLDHNLLFWLSQGVECHIYDFGTRRPISKTISIGLPLIKRLLEYVWLNIECDDTLFCKVCHRCIKRAETKSAQDAKRKLNYYKKLLNTTEIKLFGHSRSTYNDGNIPFYKECLRKNRCNDVH